VLFKKRSNKNHHLTISPSHQLTISPSHHLTISPSNHLTISPTHLYAQAVHASVGITHLIIYRRAAPGGGSGAHVLREHQMTDAEMYKHSLDYMNMLLEYAIHFRFVQVQAPKLVPMMSD
jgi:hypothetical protein